MPKLREFFLALILVFTSLFFFWGTAELLFRAALFVDAFPDLGLREPWRYADGDYDDDFWKLMYVFDKLERGAPVNNPDPDLGWDTRPTEEDPLGIHASEPYRIEDIADPILFYGDSFVAGKQNIPWYLDALLPQRSVLNLGVGGYGVDQIFLKFSKTIEAFENPLVLVGILTYDLDRSILGIRGHQKPYFDIENGELVLKNTPVNPTTEEYIEQNPVEINSYFTRFVFFRLRKILSPTLFNRLVGYSEAEKKKRLVNMAILRELKKRAELEVVRPRVIIFYAGEEIHQPTWREAFLKENLAALDIDFFDSRNYLLEHMNRTGILLQDLYEEDFGHLNQNGRQVVAFGLAQWIASTDAEF